MFSNISSVVSCNFYHVQNLLDGLQSTTHPLKFHYTFLTSAPATSRPMYASILSLLSRLAGTRKRQSPLPMANSLATEGGPIDDDVGKGKGRQGTRSSHRRLSTGIAFVCLLCVLTFARSSRGDGILENHSTAELRRDRSVEISAVNAGPIQSIHLSGRSKFEKSIFNPRARGEPRH